MNKSRTQQHVILNGGLCSSDTARISPLGDGFLFGSGLFETIKVRQGSPVFFRDHARRLHRGADELGLRCVADDDALLSRCNHLLAADGVSEGSLKIVVFQAEDGVGELILTDDRRYKPDQYENGFRIRTELDARHEGSLHRLKTLNHLKNIHARRAAKQAGFDDALFIGADGVVWECAGSNVFMVKSGNVSTPSVDGCILPGIARAKVFELLWGRAVSEAKITLEQLKKADEVFVTNSLMGVMPVRCIDQREYDLMRNPYTRALMKSFEDLETSQIQGGSLP